MQPLLGTIHVLCGEALLWGSFWDGSFDLSPRALLLLLSQDTETATHEEGS